MIKLHCTRFDVKGVPVLSDSDIEKFAYYVLQDYKPGLLREPGKINYAHFIESYIGANLDYQDIYNEDPDKPIFGMAVFNEGEIKVFDRERQCVKNIWVDGRTIVLDNFVMREGKEGLARFTGLHESGHLLLHAGDYAGIEFFEYDESVPFIACRSEGIEGLPTRKIRRSPADWKERQANYFAACVAMPISTFIPFVRQVLRSQGVWRSVLSIGLDDDTDYLARDLLPETIAENYGVSKTAAYIKLLKCGIVIERS